MGDFADSLPDYQKVLWLLVGVDDAVDGLLVLSQVEMMMFVIGKVPPAAASQSDRFLQYVLMKTLLKVSVNLRMS